MGQLEHAGPKSQQQEVTNALSHRSLHRTQDDRQLILGALVVFNETLVIGRSARTLLLRGIYGRFKLRHGLMARRAEQLDELLSVSMAGPINQPVSTEKDYWR